MPLSASDLIQPAGRIAPDLIPRTPDETQAYEEAGSGYETDTAKTAAYADALLSAAPDAADTDAKKRAYVLYRAYEARADVMALSPSRGEAEGAGSYGFTQQQITDARELANDFADAYHAALQDVAPIVTRLARQSRVLSTVPRF